MSSNGARGPNLMDFLSRWSAIDRLVFVDLAAVGHEGTLADAGYIVDNRHYFDACGRLIGIVAVFLKPIDSGGEQSAFEYTTTPH
ncbi:hypothetical protein B0G84_8420 [Paraburkholderia sp. BL8N3]|nr:hypothetical protein [Paraburkholderia sp. BL8N3]TCK32604.1 hypothetical protein B0G84_8420 [Paraburkholderia sp. BL8N3]